MPRDLILITSGMKAVLIVAMIHHVIYNKAHMLLIYANIPARPWLVPGRRRQPGPRHKKTSPELSRLGGSPTLPLGHDITDHFPDKVTHRA
jgi:hypothetical protein